MLGKACVFPHPPGPPRERGIKQVARPLMKGAWGARECPVGGSREPSVARTDRCRSQLRQRQSGCGQLRGDSSLRRGQRATSLTLRINLCSGCLWPHVLRMSELRRSEFKLKRRGAAVHWGRKGNPWEVTRLRNPNCLAWAGSSTLEASPRTVTKI